MALPIARTRARPHRIQSGAGLALALLIATIALGSGPALAADKVLRVAYADDIPNFDPDNAIPLYGLDALHAVYQGLVQYKPGTVEIEGVLADSWTLSPDRRTYRFQLHPGVSFHDGNPMTARAVLAYFERRRNPQLALAYFLDGVEAMSAPDDGTFEIRLAAPQPAFLDRLASAWGPKIVGPHALSDHPGADTPGHWLDEHADGTGPFMLTEFTRGQRYVLTRNPHYWGTPPWFDRIEISIIPDINQQMLLLRRGDLDLMPHGYPFDQLDHLPAGLKVESFNGLALEMAFINENKALKDPVLRHAVMTAIAPAGWIDDAFNGFATPAQSLYPRAMIAASSPLQYPSDLAAARRAVKDAGSVTLEIGYADQEASVQQRPAELIASALATIGIKATMRIVPLDQQFSFPESPQQAPDIWIAQDYPDAAHPATQTGVFFATGAPINLFNYSNPEIDRLIAAAGEITDRAERDAAYLALGERLFADGAFIPLADIKDVIVYRAGLTDLETRPALPWTADFGTIRQE